jgi:hypothetical protein
MDVQVKQRGDLAIGSVFLPLSDTARKSIRVGTFLIPFSGFPSSPPACPPYQPVPEQRWLRVSLPLGAERDRSEHWPLSRLPVPAKFCSRGGWPRLQGKLLKRNVPGETEDAICKK